MARSVARAILFDLDGTLVDSVGDLHAIAVKLLSEHGLPPLPIDTVTGFVGAGIPPLVERVFAASGCPLSGHMLQGAIERYKVLYAAAPAEHTRCYPGVGNALAQLRAKGARLGVCTNKAEAISRSVLEAVGLASHFDVVVGGDTLAVRKPDPEVLRHAARLLGMTIERAIFVGDSEIDAAAASAASVPLLLFTRGYRKAAVEALVHASAFDDFRELPGLVARFV